jgi:cell wall-associated NlpC family hydrolase
MHKVTKAAVAVASGLAMTATATMAAELPASATSGCHTTFNRYVTIKAGSSGTQARGAQCLLHSAGYSVRADGSFSWSDAAQVKRFQSRHSISRTGKVDARSWTALLSRGSTPTLHRGNRGAVVKRLQRSLTASGRPVHATGYFGPITQAAVKSLQRAKGWRATGIANRAVWHTLQSGGAVRHRAAVLPAPRRIAHTSGGGGRGARALAFAKRQLGDRYVWGASGPNRWDCSGLTRGAWRSVGVSLPHNARAQSGRGQRVSRSNLRPGDLVFFYGGIRHVGIYAGNGKIVHAANPRKGVTWGTISSMPYKGARRPG